MLQHDGILIIDAAAKAIGKNTRIDLKDGKTMEEAKKWLGGLLEAVPELGNEVIVPEKHRGNGYNKLIMDVLLKWCKDRNIFEIRLDVYDNNPSAIRAYEKVGLKKHLINMRMDITNLDI